MLILRKHNGLATKLSNVFNECCKKVKAKMSEAIVEHHVHVREEIRVEERKTNRMLRCG